MYCLGLRLIGMKYLIVILYFIALCLCHLVIQKVDFFNDRITTFSTVETVYSH